MKILIIEDEEQSANKLKNYLAQLDASVQILAILKSVKESVAYLKTHSEPDLIFLDVQLSDGESFEIFEQVASEAFIIFITAYDQHSLQAFDLNTISYLLKPFDRSDVTNALDKYKRMLSKPKTAEKIDRFMVKKGTNFYTLNANDIAYFIKDQVLFLVTKGGHKYLYDSSLNNLEQSLDTQLFFRISRNCIVNYDSIESFKAYSSHRYLLNLIHEKQDELIVSQSRASRFKKWIHSKE